MKNKIKFICSILAMAAGFTAIITGIISFIVAFKPIVNILKIESKNIDNE